MGCERLVAVRAGGVVWTHASRVGKPARAIRNARLHGREAVNGPCGRAIRGALRHRREVAIVEGATRLRAHPCDLDEPLAVAKAGEGAARRPSVLKSNGDIIKVLRGLLTAGVARPRAHVRDRVDRDFSRVSRGLERDVVVTAVGSVAVGLLRESGAEGNTRIHVLRT